MEWQQQNPKHTWKPSGPTRWSEDGYNLSFRSALSEPSTRCPPYTRATRAQLAGHSPAMLQSFLCVSYKGRYTIMQTLAHSSSPLRDRSEPLMNTRVEGWVSCTREFCLALQAERRSHRCFLIEHDSLAHPTASPFQ